jgi:hypothetical protein
MAGLRKGYPGLASTAEYIKKYIPKSKIYCEPFAGMGRTVEYKHDKIILNDMSDVAVKYLKNTFPNTVVTQEDFETCIKRWDSDDTFFFCDPPWNPIDYKLNPNTFCNRGVGYYYSKCRELLSNSKSKWIIAGRALGGSRSTVTVYFDGYNNKIIYGNKTINGHTTKVKLYSNMELI